MFVDVRRALRLGGAAHAVFRRHGKFKRRFCQPGDVGGGDFLKFTVDLFRFIVDFVFVRSRFCGAQFTGFVYGEVVCV